jgi:hypothetical protein
MKIIKFKQFTIAIVLGFLLASASVNAQSIVQQTGLEENSAYILFWFGNQFQK